jgi:hypothetical protein
MSVTCRAASFCVAVDGSGDYLTWNGRSWSAPVQIDLTGDGFESISCGSRSSCVAVDWDGNALRWNGTSWTTPALSCPHDTTSSAGQCKMVGSYADPRAGILTSVSCPDRSFCAAVDGNGEALTSGGRQPDGLQPSWSPPATIDPIAGVLTAVSCSSASFCAAVDGSGHALTWNGVSWSRPVWSVSTPVDRGGGALTSVSCPASPAGSAGSFCVAVDGNGRALAWNGRSWSAPRLVDPRGGLTSVSCAARGFCLAVDGGGRALAWNGRSWSAPRLVNPRGGLTAVSCPVRGYCIAADFDGQTVALHPSQPGHHGH